MPADFNPNERNRAFSGAAPDRAPGAAADASGDPRTVAAILRSAPQAVILFNVEGLVVDWSPAAERLLGYRRGEAVGRDLLGMIFPPRLHAALEAVIASRGSAWGEAAERALEVAVLTREGEERPAEMTLSWASGAELFVIHLSDRRELSEREHEVAFETQRRAAMNRLGRTVLSPADLDSLLDDVVHVAAEFGSLDSCEIWDLEADGDLVLRRALGPRFAGAPRGLRARAASGSQLEQSLSGNGERLLFGDLLLPNPLEGPRMLETTEQPGAAGFAAIVAGSSGPIGVLTGVARAGFSFTRSEGNHFVSLTLIIASAIERSRFASTISEAEGRLRAVIERLPAITYVAGLGADGRWHFISPQVEEILGFSPNECLDDPQWWDRQVHPEDLQWVLAEEERCASVGGALDIEYRIRDRQGRMLWVRDRAAIGHRNEQDEDEIVVEGLMVDITAQKLAELRLRHDAEHDSLTGLLNRRGFEQHLNRQLGSGARYDGGCVAVVDIDHMKRLNDALGHAAGDDFLREVARTIAGALDGGQLVGRLSSDEFVLYAPGLSELQAREMLEAINGRIRALRTPVTLTASIGATMVTPPRSAAELLVAADVALYGAKREGRNRVTLDPGTTETGVDWLGQVRAAIEAGSLAIFSQPIFDLRSGERHSEELLARMLGEDGRPIDASQFIPAAERFGLIQQLDRFVLERALEAVASGRPVNVNVSAASIAETELTDLAGAALADGNGNASLLTFEITETGPTPELDSLRDFSARVRELGCKLSLDDVGTGFGSLTYLQNLDFDQIKIDNQFVRGLEHGVEADEGIVRSLVALAQELGLETVGEGIGSARTHERLIELGVDYGQGFHLGPPTPLATISPTWQPISPSSSH